MFLSSLCLVPFVVGAAVAVQTVMYAAPGPSVQLDDGTFIGTSDGVVDRFLGIPFGKPPTGNLRFNLPVAVDPYKDTHAATAFGPACPQQSITRPNVTGLDKKDIKLLMNGPYKLITPDSEDCLSINVIIPAGTKPGAKLPVAVWIFGGGFQAGGTDSNDGGVIVRRSIELDEPVVYVSMNYRVSAFGFLASQEVKDAGVGNLGLQDQRLALRWVQKYISAFGGDPTKVTIWGESAGAISVALHLLTNGGNTEGLFRGAFMQSGAPIPTGDITNGQAHYDGLVAATGCSGASDTLQCLRGADYNTLKAAVDATPNIFSYESLRLTWLPRADGVFLTDNPQKLVQQGTIANVSFVTGNCDDEGTAFSLSNRNITTGPQLHTYLKQNYAPAASDEDIDTILQVYTDDVTQGSPFDTGSSHALTPQYKRIAAIQGDLVFQAPRRFFLEATAGKQSTWSFLSKRLKIILKHLGSAHGTDLFNIYMGGDMTDYLVNFVNNLDPNGATVIDWPQYSLDTREQLTFQSGLIGPRLQITTDDYRVDGFNVLTELALRFPI